MSDFPTHAEARALPAAPAWTANAFYATGRLVWQAGTLYRAKTDHTSGSSFSATNWDAAGAGGGGGGGAVTSWAGWRDMSGGYGNVGGPNGDGFGVGRNAYTLPESGGGSVFVSRDVPPGWSTMAVDLYCYLPSGSPGGNVWAKLNVRVDANGSDISESVAAGGSASAFAAPAALMTMTVRTVAAGLSVPALGGVFNAFFERFSGSAEDTCTADLRVHGLLMRKTS